MCPEDLNEGDLEGWDLSVQEDTSKIQLDLETNVNVCPVDSGRPENYTLVGFIKKMVFETQMDIKMQNNRVNTKCSSRRQKQVWAILRQKERWFLYFRLLKFIDVLLGFLLGIQIFASERAEFKN
jgi:hypothetical protein